MDIESHWLSKDFGRLLALLSRDRRRNVYLKVLWVALMMMATGQALVQAAESDQDQTPECKCRAPGGQMQELGTVQCFDIVGHRNLVRCEMSTNTPYWKRVEGVSGCPDA